MKLTRTFFACVLFLIERRHRFLPPDPPHLNDSFELLGRSFTFGTMFVLFQVHFARGVSFFSHEKILILSGRTLLPILIA